MLRIFLFIKSPQYLCRLQEPDFCEATEAMRIPTRSKLDRLESERKVPPYTQVRRQALVTYVARASGRTKNDRNIPFADGFYANVVNDCR